MKVPISKCSVCGYEMVFMVCGTTFFGCPGCRAFKFEDTDKVANIIINKDGYYERI